jgi:hypothetical protein
MKRNPPGLSRGILKRTDVHNWVDGFGSRVGGKGLVSLAGAGFPTSGAGNGQIALVLPLASPRLACPALEGDGTNGRPVFIADHFAPGTGVCGTDLGRTASHAKQALATRGQACHGSPILSACGFSHTHCFKLPRPSIAVERLTQPWAAL